MAKFTTRRTLAARLRRLANNVDAATSADDLDQWAELFDEFVDRALDVGTIGERGKVKDPR